MATTKAITPAKQRALAAKKEDKKQTRKALFEDNSSNRYGSGTDK